MFTILRKVKQLVNHRELHQFVLMNNEKLVKIIQQLHNLGFVVALILDF